MIYLLKHSEIKDLSKDENKKSTFIINHNVFKFYFNFNILM